jgi:prepilin-type N-terminal cleavage/methylation domain-containing protein
MKLNKKSRQGFTIIELLVVVSIIALLIGILLPALGRARDAALQSTSLSNLRQMAAGLGAYSGDWNDRQPTLIPDDFCQTGGSVGNCSAYISNIGCPAQPILGWANFDGGRALWGYWIDDGGVCAGVGGCGNIVIALPYDASTQVGFFRQPNMKIFAQYMNNRYYDRVFYAPKDRRKIERVEKYFELADEFDYEGIIEWSSYCFAASAMFSPDIWDAVRNNDGNGTLNDSSSPPCDTSNGGGPAGLKSPPVGHASYPDLKTRMLEHEWLQNPPGAGSDTNPLFSGGNTPYYFNHGIRSAPCATFFDGSCRIIGVQESTKSNQRVERQTDGQSLWINDWLGKDYYEAQSYGFPEEETSFHVMTRHGIKGRDTIGEE